MAYDEGQAQMLRDALADLEDLSERRMFGGLCLMWRGNMLCGVHKNGGMARVGKELHAEALAIEGVGPMAFTGRPMGGMVEFDDDVFADDRLTQVLDLARAFIGSLPAK